MQTETPNTETTQVQSYIEFVIEFITDEHFQQLEEKTKQQYYERFKTNVEDQLKNEYNKGFFAGTIEGMQKMADALNNSKK